jgi:4a-hydroxytetrahydrobiopterin dehydratase
VVARLEGNARQQSLAGLKGWKEDAGRDAIAKEFRFADFNQAFAFMTQIALKAERMDHHPEWSNVYNRVSVSLSTHECGGVSQRDIDMARFIDTLAAGSVASP